MKRGMSFALSGESYFSPSLAEDERKYHRRREVFASCCPSHV